MNPKDFDRLLEPYFLKLEPSALQRVLLWERRNNIVPPFGETVQQVFARISALRDSLDGPAVRLPLLYIYSCYSC